MPRRERRSLSCSSPDHESAAAAAAGGVPHCRLSGLRVPTDGWTSAVHVLLTVERACADSEEQGAEVSSTVTGDSMTAANRLTARKREVTTFASRTLMRMDKGGL